MKKKSLFNILIIMICLILVGCRNNEKQTKYVDGGWDIVLTDKQANITDDAKDAFDNASNKDKYNLEIVALLAKQIVAGTNYMFLGIDNDTNNYKIIVVCKDLDNVSQIIQINNFDYTKYVHNNIQYNANKTTGQWEVVIPDQMTELDNEVKDIYNVGIEKVDGIDFQPIALIGKQIVAGTNYAVLAYGKIQQTNSTENKIFLLTIYKDLNGIVDIPSISYIDLKKYKK